MTVRLAAGEANCFNNFFQQSFPRGKLFGHTISQGKEVVTSCRSESIGQFFITDYFLADPDSYLVSYFNLPFDYGGQHFHGSETDFLRPVALLPYFDKLDSQGGIDILTLNHTVDTFNGLFYQIGSGECVEQERVEFFGRFEVVEDRVEEHECGCRIRGSLQSLVQQLL